MYTTSEVQSTNEVKHEMNVRSMIEKFSKRLKERRQKKLKLNKYVSLQEEFYDWEVISEVKNTVRLMRRRDAMNQDEIQGDIDLFNYKLILENLGFV